MKACTNQTLEQRRRKSDKNFEKEIEEVDNQYQ